MKETVPAAPIKILDWDKMVMDTITQKDSVSIALGTDGITKAEFKAKTIGALNNAKKDLALKNGVVTVSIASKAISKKLVSSSSSANGTCVMGITVGSSKLAELAQMTSNKTLKNAGITVCEITAQSKISNVSKDLGRLATPMKVTVDLSKFTGNTSSLTGVRIITKKDGSLGIVKLGGSYDAKKKTFTFCTDQSGTFTVMTKVATK